MKALLYSQTIVVYLVYVDTVSSIYACLFGFPPFFFLLFLFLFLWYPPLVFFVFFFMLQKGRRDVGAPISIESVRAVAVRSLVRRSGPERDPSDSRSHLLFFV